MRAATPAVCLPTHVRLTPGRLRPSTVTPALPLQGGNACRSPAYRRDHDAPARFQRHSPESCSLLKAGATVWCHGPSWVMPRNILEPARPPSPPSDHDPTSPIPVAKRERTHAVQKTAIRPRNDRPSNFPAGHTGLRHVPPRQPARSHRCTGTHTPTTQPPAPHAQPPAHAGQCPSWRMGSSVLYSNQSLFRPPNH